MMQQLCHGLMPRNTALCGIFARQHQFLTEAMFDSRDLIRRGKCLGMGLDSTSRGSVYVRTRF